MAEFSLLRQCHWHQLAQPVAGTSSVTATLSYSAQSVISVRTHSGLLELSNFVLRSKLFVHYRNGRMDGNSAVKDLRANFHVFTEPLKYFKSSSWKIFSLL